MPESAQTPAKSGRNAALVAAGILASRLFGLARQKIFAMLLGTGLEAAAFSAATRIPNVLQNLLGEGVLSASFIPVYAGLRAQGKDQEAREVAGAVFGLLSLVVGVIVALGLLAAPLLVTLIAPGYQGQAFDLTVHLVRIIFPGTGVLVMSAWCLGVLNSHKRFFLSYAAPVIWNVCIVAVLIVWRHEPPPELILWVAVATVVGSVAQFGVQLPATLRLLGGFKPWPTIASPSVRLVLTGFLPAVAARGVVQISAYVDTAYASLAGERAVATLTYAQTIALLPVSLFGMAISAAELPEMSADAMKSDDERTKALRERLTAGLARMRFFVIPSVVAFLFLGDFISAALLQSGRFTAGDSRFIWYILIGSGVALFSQTSGRLYSSTFYALKDTRSPLRFAAIRVSVGVALGYFAVRQLPALLGLPAEYGAVFITATTSLSAALEMWLLKRGLEKRLGSLPEPPMGDRLWVAAVISGMLALAAKYGLTQWLGAADVAELGGTILAPPKVLPTLTSIGILGLFGVNYFLMTFVMGIAQSRALVGRFLKRRRG